ncbi:MAG: ATP-binding protein [Rickettsiales bacterium]|jgi:hypothetical protein|nr:ATP-binding protein [Rickettsiales bacterium]
MTAKLLIFTGRPGAGKTRRMTFLANRDPDAVFLGCNNHEADGFLRQSRTIKLDPSVPFIYYKHGEPPALADIAAAAPNAKNIYIDEAQHGGAVGRAILEWLAAGFNVIAGGAMHAWDGTEALMRRADKIVFVEGGGRSIDNAAPEIVAERERRLCGFVSRFGGKLKIIPPDVYAASPDGDDFLRAAALPAPKSR